MSSAALLERVRLVGVRADTLPPESQPATMSVHVGVDNLRARVFEDLQGESLGEVAVTLSLRLDAEADPDDEPAEPAPPVCASAVSAAGAGATVTRISATFLLTYAPAPPQAALAELATKQALFDVWSPWLYWLHAQLAAMNMATTTLPARPPASLAELASRAFAKPQPE